MKKSIFVSKEGYLKRFFYAILVSWFLFFIAMFYFEYTDYRNILERITYSEAKKSLEKDFVFRKWVSEHGGFYVKISEDVKPNKFLSHLNENVITDTNGIQYALLNPAYLLKLLYESDSSNTFTKNRIVSLEPLNPKNMADKWEAMAIEKFENGEKEYGEYFYNEGKEYFKLMMPFPSEQKCLKCHITFNNSKSTIRGAVSVIISTENANLEAKIAMYHSMFGYFVVWFFGGAVFFYGFSRLRYKIQEMERIEDQLISISQYLASLSGEAFFESLTKRLSDSLGMDIALVSEVNAENTIATSLAFFANGEYKPNFCYTLENTPCNIVVENGICAYSENVANIFPEDRALTDWGIESYVGSPLKDQQGNVIGVICVLSTKKLFKVNFVESILKFFAIRAAGELERIRVQRKLELSESRLKEAHKIANLGSWELDLITGKLIWSDEIYEIFEIPKSDFSASYETFLSRIAIYDKDRVDEAYTNSVKNKTSYEISHDIVMSDGRVKHVFEQGRTFYDETGKAIKSVGSIQYVTEHKRMENEIIKAQKNDSLGLLAGGIAHDFNNILTAIQGNTSLAQMVCKDVKMSEYLHNLEIASNKAAAIARQLLMFAKRGEPLKRVVNPRNVIANSVSLALSGSNVSDEVSIGIGLWNVDADETHLEQVFTNLLINATHSMPNGGKVRIEAENVTFDSSNKFNLLIGEYVRISVKDNGCGIPPENLQKIFDPYFTTKEKGSGLGLATTYTIIRNHHGAIDVSSVLGVGTTFDIYLPASKMYAAEDRFEEILVQEKVNRRVLIMDDDELVLGLANDIFHILGYTVVLSHDGKEAIEKYKESLVTKAHFDLVIMDLTVPGGMGGKEAVSHILSLDPKAKVMVSSGYSSDPIMERYAEYGFIASMPKPYKLNDVIKQMKQIFPWYLSTYFSVFRIKNVKNPPKLLGGFFRTGPGPVLGITGVILLMEHRKEQLFNWNYSLILLSFWNTHHLWSYIIFPKGISSHQQIYYLDLLRNSLYNLLDLFIRNRMILRQIFKLQLLLIGDIYLELVSVTHQYLQHIYSSSYLLLSYCKIGYLLRKIGIQVTFKDKRFILRLSL